MKKIRDLLADCRIELRLHVRDFHKTELCKRLDEARAELANDSGKNLATASTETDANAAGDRVAMAWRLAAEDLHVTAPAIYQLLAKKAAKYLADLPDELLQAAAPATVASAPGIAAAAPAPIATPVVAVPTTEPEVAPVATEAPAEVVAAEAEATPEPVAEAQAADATDPNAPSHEVLLSISRHKRRFTEAQREWCVGEALIRSGFTINPSDFLAGGDHAMALYMLESETTTS
ncbi:MAG: hypothetical protein IPG63_01590 [Xanthomonadales bacterium]|nr:hypothetical protein [Xanthomonadales bacterium]MBK7145056.1 hypothetical protein [Xanthomonadales bacterium]MCC6562631.1 hypothetical protein [Xanthomonadales bacterium]